MSATSSFSGDAALFALLGVMNPLTAKFLPDLLGNFMPEGITILIAEPTNLDSWSILQERHPNRPVHHRHPLERHDGEGEYEKGTLINMVTKGLPRRTITFLLRHRRAADLDDDFLALFFITLGYTLYYFPEGTTENLSLSVISLYLFGILLIAVLLLRLFCSKTPCGHCCSAAPS